MFKYRLKQHLNKEIPKQIGAWLGELEQLDGFDYTTVMLKYLLNFFGEEQGKEFIDELKPYLTPHLEREIMTIGEQLRYEGMQQGLQQGLQQGKAEAYIALARNMQMRGFDPAVIKEITGLTDHDITEFSVA